MKFVKQTAHILVAAFIVSGSYNAAQAAGDATVGKKIFKKCMACHQIGDGAKNKTGPVLTGVVGRKAGTYPGYSYGKGMRKLRDTGLVWTEENIEGWLTNPKKFLRKILDNRKAKAKMRFKLKKPEERMHVIAFLKTFSADADIVTQPANVKSPSTPVTEKADLPMAASDICIENRSGKTLLFVVEAKGGARVVKTLGTSENLCATQEDANAGGTVGVFENIDALEGCSRLAKAGTAERLIAYEPFDNCKWAH